MNGFLIVSILLLIACAILVLSLFSAKSELYELKSQLELKENEVKAPQEDIVTCACAYREIAKLYGICDAQLDTSVRYAGPTFRKTIDPLLGIPIDCSNVSIYT